jgi:hypothetical protein
MHPPPRKPDTFAKKSHRRSPNRRTNRTSCASSSSVQGPFLIAGAGAAIVPPPLLICSPSGFLFLLNMDMVVASGCRGDRKQGIEPECLIDREEEELKK